MEVLNTGADRSSLFTNAIKTTTFGNQGFWKASLLDDPNMVLIYKLEMTCLNTYRILPKFKTDLFLTDLYLESGRKKGREEKTPEQITMEFWLKSYRF